METRKIQLTGESTYTVSLPKKWAAKMNLGAGDTVALVPQPNGTILVDPRMDARRSAKKKVIQIQSETPETFFRKLVGAYISGFSVIEVRSGRALNQQTRAVVRDFRTKVIGFEVVDETPNSVTLQDLLDSVDLPPRKALRRMSILVEKMFQDAGLALLDGNNALAQDVMTRDLEVDRLCWLVSKQYRCIIRDLGYAEKLGVGQEECLQYLLVSKLLERIGDHAVRVCRTMLRRPADMKPETSRELASLLELSLEMLRGAMDAMLRGDLVKANVVGDMREELNKRSEAAVEKVLQFESVTAAHYTQALVSLRRAGLYATDITEATTNYLMGLD